MKTELKAGTQLDLLDEIAQFHHRKDQHEKSNGNLSFEYCNEGLCALQFRETSG